MVYFKIIMSANGPMPIRRKLCQALHLLAAYCAGEIVPMRLLRVAVSIAFLAPYSIALLTTPSAAALAVA